MPTSGSRTPIIMAMDLRDAISPEIVKQKAKSLESLKDKDVDIDELAKVISSVQGMTLGITINEKVFGRLKVDFAEDASSLKGIAKPLLLGDSGQPTSDDSRVRNVERAGRWEDGVHRRLSRPEWSPTPNELDRSADTRCSIALRLRVQARTRKASSGLLRNSTFKQVTSLVEDLRQKAESDGDENLGTGWRMARSLFAQD